MPTDALRPILRWTTIFAVSFLVTDVVCGGARIDDGWPGRKLPIAIGIGVAVGLAEYRRRRPR